MLFNVWEEKVIDKVMTMMIMGMTMVKIGMLYFVIRGGAPVGIAIARPNYFETSPDKHHNRGKHNDH